jgi:hypothetical protein
METITATDIERFWSKVDKAGDCWQWKAFIHPETGYGFFYYRQRTGGAHRFAFEVTNGTIPSGMQIDHICHNRSCVNPEHLRLATQKQNAENPGGPYASSKSGVRGVTWDKRRNAWVAVVVHNSKRHYVGSFTNLEDADLAVRAKRNELFTHNELDRQGRWMRLCQQPSTRKHNAPKP